MSAYNDKNCIYDLALNTLLKEYYAEENFQIRGELKRHYNLRRSERGLSTREVPYDGIDFSNTRVLLRTVTNLHQKNLVIKDADLSSVIFDNCDFSHAGFVNCNLKGTVFKNCRFLGESITFFKSDMQGAIIYSNCKLEKGYTWKVIYDWGEWKEELVSRGAVNADKVRLFVKQD